LAGRSVQIGSGNLANEGKHAGGAPSG